MLDATDTFDKPESVNPLANFCHTTNVSIVFAKVSRKCSARASAHILPVPKVSVLFHNTKWYSSESGAEVASFQRAGLLGGEIDRIDRPPVKTALTRALGEQELLSD